MVEAIEYSQGNALDTFWVGNQFGHSTGEASGKEFQIKKFTSYFGTNLSLRF